MRDERTGRLRGVEAVVDKDLTAALLAEALGMDAQGGVGPLDRAACGSRGPAVGGYRPRWTTGRTRGYPL